MLDTLGDQKYSHDAWDNDGDDDKDAECTGA